MNSFPSYPLRTHLSLDGIWNFTFLDGDAAPQLSDFSPIGLSFEDVELVPGVFDATAVRAGRRGLGVYQRIISAPATGQYELSCGGFLLSAQIYVDGIPVAFAEVPYNKVRFVFNLEAGNHEFVIACDNRFSEIWRDYYDFYAYGGIFRHLDLYLLPPSNAIRRTSVFTLNLKGDLRIVVETINSSFSDTLPLSVSFDNATPFPVEASFTNGRATLLLSLPNPTPWSPENPVLHTITVASNSDAVTERFGLRTLRTEKGQILLNDSPIKLRGYNRHESNPDLGPALGPQQHLQDLQILKDLGCNFIRGCHYPQNQEFLDLCDVMGFLVWEESLAWGNQQEQLENQVFINHQLKSTELMVRESINHPSVILWGFLNECASDAEPARPLIAKLSKTIRNIDSSRLITFASNRQSRDICLEYVDVISFNAYPSWYGVDNVNPWPLQEVAKQIQSVCDFVSQPQYADKPFIISEVGGAALYGCHDRIGTAWSEEYQALLLDEICRCILPNERIAGLALWMFTDSRTHVFGLTRPRGFNNKGTLDEYRRPKLAYDVIKSYFTNEP